MRDPRPDARAATATHDPRPTGVQDETVARLAALSTLHDSAGPLPDGDDTGPTYWPALSGDEASAEWGALRMWVEQLQERFPHLDHHVIPRCWFRHMGHVEALAALRDHERVSYDVTSPASAAVDWHRAFRDIEARLREWTGQLACGATHEVRARQVRPVDAAEWEAFVAEDVARRARAGSPVCWCGAISDDRRDR